MQEERKNSMSEQTLSYTEPNSSQSKGLGDTIEKITTATGIKKIVDTVSTALNKDCGCQKRKEALNNAFPYENKN